MKKENFNFVRKSDKKDKVEINKKISRDTYVRISYYLYKKYAASKCKKFC